MNRWQPYQPGDTNFTTLTHRLTIAPRLRPAAQKTSATSRIELSIPIEPGPSTAS